MAFQGQLQEVVIVFEVVHLETNESHFWRNPLTSGTSHVSSQA